MSHIIVDAMEELLTTHRLIDLDAVRCAGCDWSPADPPLIQAQRQAHRRHQAEIIADALGV